MTDRFRSRRARAVAACTALVLLFGCGPGDDGSGGDAATGDDGKTEGVRYLEDGGVVLGRAWPGPERRLYSQGNEEVIIRDFFGDRRGGVFLDVGSSTPIQRSTTYFLERHLGWSGIAIDALAEHAPAFARHRPRTRFVSYIVTDHSGSIEKFYRVKGATGLSSTRPDRKWMGRELETETLEVPTITLDDLLVESGIEHVDFLSMDIEGGAPKALAGFDIERFGPELVCIEKPVFPGPIEAYFAEHGYERISRYDEYDYVNWYYAPSGTPDRPAAAD